jgi:hypothetical protein
VQLPGTRKRGIDLMRSAIGQSLINPGQESIWTSPGPVQARSASEKNHNSFEPRLHFQDPFQRWGWVATVEILPAVLDLPRKFCCSARSSWNGPKTTL